MHISFVLAQFHELTFPTQSCLVLYVFALICCIHLLLLLLVVVVAVVVIVTFVISSSIFLRL